MNHSERLTGAQVETHVRAIIDQVERGVPAEDDRIELKREWPVPVEVARQLAGHCNASQGESVLWIIGLDEKGAKAPGAKKAQDPADWHAQLRREFDGPVPELICHRNVSHNEVVLTALLFASDETPYVVHRKERDGNLDVPFRNATGVRSATRSQLLKMLTVAGRRPQIEITSATGEMTRTDEWGHVADVTVNVRLFVELPPTLQRLSLPSHRAKFSLEVDDMEVELAGCDWSCRLSSERDNNLDISGEPGQEDSARGTLQLQASTDLELQVNCGLSRGATPRSWSSIRIRLDIPDHGFLVVTRLERRGNRFDDEGGVVVEFGQPARES